MRSVRALLSGVRGWLRGSGAHAIGAGSLPGADVSAWNGPPAGWRDSAGRISWAAVKISELQGDGTRYQNPDASADWAWLKAAGKGRIAYCYGHPAAFPSETVTLFADVVRGLGLEDGDGIALDLEVTDGHSPAEVAAWGRAVMLLLHDALGRQPVLYTYLSFAEGGNCAGLGQYPLWVADPSDSPGHPRIPPPWTSWAIHQYSVSGSLDRDTANWPTLAAMRAALGAKASPPSPALPPEDSMLLNKGAGAVTPVAVPSGAKSVRLYCAEGTADLEWALVGEPVHSLRLTPASSEVLALPAGKHAVKVVRKDGGSNDVAVVAEA